jgi:hypothetical protein
MLLISDELVKVATLGERALKRPHAPIIRAVKRPTARVNRACPPIQFARDV